MDLSGYRISYEVTCLPTILYAGLHPLNNLPKFESFHIPSTLRTMPIECRVILYDDKGEALDFSSTMVAAIPSIVTSTINLLPLKMIDAFLTKLDY